MKVFLASLSLLLTASQMTFAYTPKEGNISAIFGPFVHKTQFEDTAHGPTPPYLGGTGLIAVGDINDYSSLEIAAFYMNKLFIRQQDGKYMAEKTQIVHITMGYRRWWNSVFSSSLAFYSAYPMGEFETVQNDFPTTNSLETSARDSTEYGLDVAMQAELFNISRITVVADVRYSRSITSRPGESGNHYGGLVGVRYLIQEKESSK